MAQQPGEQQQRGGDEREEHRLLRAVTLRNTDSIELARRRAEDALVQAKEALERKTSELARSLAMMQATLESTTDGILATDSAGRITGYNQNYLTMWRLPPDAIDALGGDHRRVLEVCARQFADPARFIARIEEIYATVPPESHDLLELADGRAIERASKVQHVAGRNAGRVWSFHDVTERRRIEEALRDETRMLELLNATGRTIGSTLELQALVQSVTDAATQLSGARFGAFFYNGRDEQSGDALVLYTLSGAPRAAFAHFGHPRATALFGPTFRGEGVVRCEDVLVDPRYGKWGPHYGMPPRHLPVRSYLAVPVVSRSGDVIGGLFFGHPEPGVFTERTERLIVGIAAQAAVAVDNARLYDDVRRAADERARLLEGERAARGEAERNSRMKDEFLASLSHELRTPLNAILGWSHILRSEIAGAGLIGAGAIPGPVGDEHARDALTPLQEGLETIERNARAQTRIIDDLLDMSRIISGKLRLDVQRVHLPSVVEAAVETVRPSANARGLRLHVVLDPLAGPVSGDPNRLQQVVWNLLSNSIKFTPRGGHVQVMLARVHSHVELSVTDTGEGIEPDFLPHVFDRFRQFDASTTRRHGGLGLGLSRRPTPAGSCRPSR